MHEIFKDLKWEVEHIRNDEELEGKLGGCSFYKVIRGNEIYAAQIRIEERRRHELIYTSALVIAKKGRHDHDYKLEDLAFYRTKEFDFRRSEQKLEKEPQDQESLDFQREVYTFIEELKARIDQQYFPNE